MPSSPFRIREKLVDEDATTMMELLPPVGWADVATKHDLDHMAALMKRDIDNLAATTKRDIDNLGLQFDRMSSELRADWRRELLQQTAALFAANAALLGIALTVTKLA